MISVNSKVDRLLLSIYFLLLDIHVIIPVYSSVRWYCAYCVLAIKLLRRRENLKQNKKQKILSYILIVENPTRSSMVFYYIHYNETKYCFPSQFLTSNDVDDNKPRIVNKQLAIEYIRLLYYNAYYAYTFYFCRVQNELGWFCFLQKKKKKKKDSDFRKIYRI